MTTGSGSSRSVGTQPRRYWQIHLATAICLMLAAGGLLYLNLHSIREQRTGPLRITIVGLNLNRDPDTLVRFGWPIRYVTRGHYDDGSPSYTIVESPGLVASVGINIGILLAVAVASERIIRRRKS